MLRASAFLPSLFAGRYSPPSSSCPHHWAIPIQGFTHSNPLTVHALQEDEPGFCSRDVIELGFSETHWQWASVMFLSSIPSNIHQYFKYCIFITSPKCPVCLPLNPARRKLSCSKSRQKRRFADRSEKALLWSKFLRKSPMNVYGTLPVSKPTGSNLVQIASLEW